MTPRRINIPIHGSATEEEARRNWESSRKRALPRALDSAPVLSDRLAVAGSGPNLDVEALREWPGDIWAVNGTAAYLAHEGIESTMFSVDPFNYECRHLLPEILDPIDAAILASHCNPLMFEHLLKNSASVYVFDVVPWEDERVNGGPTTATHAPLLALPMGYRELSFYGFEGSYDPEHSSHIQKHAVDDWHELTIRAGETEFLTAVELMLQSQNLAALIREFPDVFKDRSGGLLSGMVDHWHTWEITKMTDDMLALEALAEKAAA